VCAAVLAGVPALLVAARPQAAPAGQAASQVAIDPDDIGGVVTSANGPEAGVWVIAEAQLQTKFRKIVVTDDLGRYVLPDLPRATYKIWVRGYGLVDSKPVEGKPGAHVALTAVVAPTPRAAAEYYPAEYWLSLLTIPTKDKFPMNIPAPPPLPGVPEVPKLTHGEGAPEPPPRPSVIKNQAEWLMLLKGGCGTCHAMGGKTTREIPASLKGKYATSREAWERMLSSSQIGRRTMMGVNRFGHDTGLKMFADWGDRIAAGELPPVPPRPQGVERNIVISLWDWSVRSSFLHAQISTDKRDPSVNAHGPVYGTDWSEGVLAIVDPLENKHTMVKVPLPNEADREKLVPWSPPNQAAPSLYFGDELVWKDPVNPGPVTMDQKGRVWFLTETRLGNADYCKAGSSNKFAKFSPREDGGKGVAVYDPRTGKFELVDLCVKSTRVAFANDKDNTLFFTVNTDGGMGWLNTRIWDETHDAEKAQGWCPAIVDLNGDGKIGAYTKAPEPVDADLDRAVPSPGAYGIAINPIDGSVWYSHVQSIPGKLVRMVRGANPPETCVSEYYEPPFANPKVPGVYSSHVRGIDIDSKGLVWTPLAGEGYLGSFDRSKCAIKSGPGILDGQHCPEGWTLYPVPGPVFKSDPSVKSGHNYYMWVDRNNTLGLGNDVPILDATGSDGLIAYVPQTKTWTRMRVPYPEGFFSRFFDGRIDDPGAGWKGRGVWAGNQVRGSQLTEGGKDTPSQLAHFQIRPNPLAK
jgi:hypothetical protein